MRLSRFSKKRAKTYFGHSMEDHVALGGPYDVSRIRHELVETTKALFHAPQGRAPSQKAQFEEDEFSFDEVVFVHILWRALMLIAPR